MQHHLIAQIFYHHKHSKLPVQSFKYLAQKWLFLPGLSGCYSVFHWIQTLDKVCSGLQGYVAIIWGGWKETTCHRVKTKPSVTTIRQMAPGLCKTKYSLMPLDHLGLMSKTPSVTLSLLPLHSLYSVLCCHLTLSFTLSLLHCVPNSFS